MITVLGKAAYVSTGKHTINNTDSLYTVESIHSYISLFIQYSSYGLQLTVVYTVYSYYSIEKLVSKQMLT